MTVQELAIRSTEDAVESFFRNAHAVPADRVTWKPAEAARSVLEIAQEVAQTATWFTRTLETGAFEMPPPEIMQQALEQRKSWTTIDDCERVCRENNERLFEAIRKFPAERLDETVDLPFGGGMTKTLADMMMMHYWNTVYHYGQVAYVQTLYGDCEMH
jgi:uncharacterized damage-inducible protein DinB